MCYPNGMNINLVGLSILAAASLRAAPSAPADNGVGLLEKNFVMLGAQLPKAKAAASKRTITPAEYESIFQKLLGTCPERTRTYYGTSGSGTVDIMGYMNDGKKCHVAINFMGPKLDAEAFKDGARASIFMHETWDSVSLGSLRGGMSIAPVRSDVPPEHKWNSKYFSISVAPEQVRVIEQDGSSDFSGRLTTQTRTIAFYPSGRLKSFKDARSLAGVTTSSHHCSFAEDATTY